MTQKDRIDKILVTKRIVKNRKDAVALILSGNVFLNTRKIDKPGFVIPIDSNLEIKKRKNDKWVSRGGYKLDRAIKYLYKLFSAVFLLKFFYPTCGIN